MKDQKYWQRRAVRYERDWNKRCAETVEKRLARHYKKALSAIKDDILQLYATFAKDKGLDFNEARRALRSREFREWRMSMNEYIAANNAGLTRELNALAMSPRITRLEKLYGETLQELDKMGRKVNEDMRNFLSDAYKSNYSRDIFDLVKAGGMSIAWAKVDSPSVEKVLAARWSGKNYSQRIWTNTRLLSRVVREIVATGVHRGLSVPQLSRMIEDKMHAGYANAVRLVQTEMSFVNNQAHADSMEAAGIAWYEFIAVLDNRTSAPCRSRDGETYPLEEKTVGFNYPPLHPRCRSTVAPFIDGVSKSGTRIAKVGKDTIHIPSSMSYRDYEAVYVKKTQTFEQWQSASKPKAAEPKIGKVTEPKAKNVAKSTNILQNYVQNGTINASKPTLQGSMSCKDFEELQNYWKLKYGVRLNKPLGKLDFEAVLEATQGIEEVINEFPKAGKFLKKMKVENLDDVGAFMGADYYGVINFNKSDFIYREDFLEMIALQVADGQNPKNTKIKGIAAHEMGHLLERALIDKYNGGVYEWKHSTYSRVIGKEAVAEVRKSSDAKISYRDKAGKSRKRYVTMDELKLEISIYAKDDWSECLAEAVCDYITNGEKASRLSKEIWAILKRELG